MNDFISALIWLADALDKLAQLGWWFLPVLLPGGVVGVWVWLRPTGRHRLPRTSRAAATVQADPLPAPPVAEPWGDDTLTFQAVAPKGRETDR